MITAYLSDPANAPAIWLWALLFIGSVTGAWAAILCRRDRKACEARQRAREAADIAAWESELKERSTP